MIYKCEVLINHDQSPSKTRPISVRSCHRLPEQQRAPIEGVVPGSRSDTEYQQWRDRSPRPIPNYVPRPHSVKVGAIRSGEDYFENAPDDHSTSCIDKTEANRFR